jgi:GntR family transcriptional regulator
VEKMMLSEIKIDFSSPVPVYEQIKRQIKHALAKKILKVEDPLPSIRELANFLKINPNTVVRAYRELQQEKIIGGRAGKGFWVVKSDYDEQGKMKLLKEEFLRFVEKGVEMGVSSERIYQMINEFFKEEQ